MDTFLSPSVSVRRKKQRLYQSLTGTMDETAT